MNQSIEQFSCLINQGTLIWVLVNVIIRLKIEYHVNCSPVIWSQLGEDTEQRLLYMNYQGSAASKHGK